MEAYKTKEGKGILRQGRGNNGTARQMKDNGQMTASSDSYINSTSRILLNPKPLAMVSASG